MQGNVMRPLAVAGVMLVVAFFGPWLDLLGLVQASGWDLAREESIGWKRHVLWLYPAGGAALAWTAWKGEASAKGVALVTGLFVLGMAAYWVLGTLVHGLRYGGLMTIGGAAVAMVGGASARRRAWALVAGSVVIAGFFLPWFGEGETMSGFDFARLEGEGFAAPSWLFAMPVLGAAATLSSLTERSRRGAILAGAGVLAIWAYMYVRGASMLVGWALWVTLAAGAAALLMSLLAGGSPAPAAGKTKK